MKGFQIIIRYCLFASLCCALLITCKKEYSYEGGPPTQMGTKPADTASFSLVGAPNDCSVTLPSGFVFSGNTVTQTSVNVAVNVTTTGYYSITTDTLDNIYFSANGSFTKTGIQNVTLKGHGTPDSALNLTFTPSTPFTRCFFLMSIVPSGSLSTYVLESGYGNPNPCTYQVSGSYVRGQPTSAANTVRISVYASTTGNFAIATDIINGVRFYYNGSFTTTGTQNVLLQASGTPLKSGTFSYSPSIVGPSPLGGKTCAFDVTIQ